MTAYWVNPYKDAIPVPLEDLADLVVHYGCETSEEILAWFRLRGPKLDAYILPDGAFYSVGVRYGAEEWEYLSPLGDQTKIRKYLEQKSRKDK